jgi:hypothetical protein
MTHPSSSQQLKALDTREAKKSAAQQHFKGAFFELGRALCGA